MLRRLKRKTIWKKEPVPAGFFGFTCKIDIGVEVFKTIYAVRVAHAGVFIKVGGGSLGFFILTTSCGASGIRNVGTSYDYIEKRL